MPGSLADRREKQRRVAALRTGPLLLASHEAVSWYLEGIRSHVSLAGPPVAAVRIDDDGDRIFVAENEADRLVAEELLPSDAVRVVRVPWVVPPADAAAAADAAAGSVGGPAASEASVAPALRAARASLLPAERDRYRALGRDAAEAVTDAAAMLRPTDSEQRAASVLAAALVERAIDPLVILAAGSSRLGHRHPLPTGAPLGRRAMLVVCGRRHGLIANATRWVGEGDPADDAILAVEAAFLGASTPGARLDRVFAAGAAAYAAEGFAADERRRHHQGGPTGYSGRDPRATPDATDLLHDHQAFAWNPTAPGVKVEDTVLVSSGGVEVLTTDPRWPTTSRGGLARPLARPF